MNKKVILLVSLIFFGEYSNGNSAPIIVIQEIEFNIGTNSSIESYNKLVLLLKSNGVDTSDLEISFQKLQEHNINIDTNLTKILRSEKYDMADIIMGNQSNNAGVHVAKNFFDILGGTLKDVAWDIPSDIATVVDHTLNDTLTADDILSPGVTTSLVGLGLAGSAGISGAAITATVTGTVIAGLKLGQSIAEGLEGETFDHSQMRYFEAMTGQLKAIEEHNLRMINKAASNQDDSFDFDKEKRIHQMIVSNALDVVEHSLNELDSPWNAAASWVAFSPSKRTKIISVLKDTLAMLENARKSHNADKLIRASLSVGRGLRIARRTSNIKKGVKTITDELKTNTPPRRKEPSVIEEIVKKEATDAVKNPIVSPIVNKQEENRINQFYRDRYQQNNMMQNNLSSITSGGSSRIGTASYFIGRPPAQDRVEESSETVANLVGEQEQQANAVTEIPTVLSVRETSQYTNGVILEAPVDIMLRWGATPNDLDSHLTGPSADGSTTRFHTYYGSRGSLDSAPNAKLHTDYTNHTSGGANSPEQTRINVLNEGVYRFYAHDFTNRNAVDSTVLSSSGASVTFHNAGSTSIVEGEGIGAQIAEINVPTGQTGNTWQAFELDSRTGILNQKTEFRTISNVSEVPFNE